MAVNQRNDRGGEAVGVLRAVCAAVLITVLPWTALAQDVDRAQQTSGDVWRCVAQKLGSGTEVNVRRQNGQRFAATLLDPRADALILPPRSPRPVPTQPIRYHPIGLLQPRHRA